MFKKIEVYPPSTAPKICIAQTAKDLYQDFIEECPQFLEARGAGQKRFATWLKKYTDAREMELIKTHTRAGATYIFKYKQNPTN